ncbi:MAG TPA: hypothetical protein VGK64_04365 [Bryobacteraceae bacterium]
MWVPKHRALLRSDHLRVAVKAHVGQDSLELRAALGLVIANALEGGSDAEVTVFLRLAPKFGEHRYFPRLCVDGISQVVWAAGDESFEFRFFCEMLRSVVIRRLLKDFRQFPVAIHSCPGSESAVFGGVEGVTLHSSHKILFASWTHSFGSEQVYARMKPIAAMAAESVMAAPVHPASWFDGPAEATRSVRETIRHY